MNIFKNYLFWLKQPDRKKYYNPLALEIRLTIAKIFKLGKDYILPLEHITDGTPCWCDPVIEDYRELDIDEQTTDS